MKKRFVLLLSLLAIFAILLTFWYGTSKSSKPTPQSYEQSNNLSPESSKDTQVFDTRPTSKDSDANLLATGGRTWKLHFSDGALPGKAQQAIYSDLNLIFSNFPRFEIDALQTPLELDGIRLDRRVRFEGGTRKRPKALINSGFGHYLVGSHNEALFVPKSVSDSYLRAIALQEENASAYALLTQFLDTLNHLHDKPVDNVSGLFVVTDDYQSAKEDLENIRPSDFVKAWGEKKYAKPSILEVGSTSGTPLAKYGSLVAYTHANAQGAIEHLPPLIYSQGRWAFLLQRPPT